MQQAQALALAEDEQALIRSLILADPRLVLDDDKVMRALIGANPGQRNVVDLRDRLVARMEERLKALLHTNRSVIAAAYENVATTNQVHRAVLALAEAPSLNAFLDRLTREVPTMLGVEEARLCLEADVDEARPATELGEGLERRVILLPEGTVEAYMVLDGATPGRPVVLRPCPEEAEIVFGHVSPCKSEALMPITPGPRPALLAFGAADPERFGPDQGIDLLTFAAGVVERMLARHLRDG
ncbi:MAG: DUF484 family protein [Pseudomonadota bacterium]